MLHATLDYETKSRAELKKVGAFKYASDPSTAVLCLVYRLPGAKPRLWTPGRALPLDLFAWVENGGLVEAHNAEFEFAMWNYHCRPTFEAWPELRIEQVRCSAAKAAALALPRKLEDLGKALNLPIQKDMGGHRLMLKLSKPRKATKASAAPWHDDPEDFKRLYNYCLRDVLTEEAASALMPPLMPSEETLFHLTMKINARGIYCNVEACKNALRFAELYSDELLAEFRALTNDTIQTTGQLDKLIAFLKIEEGVDVPDLTVATVSAALLTELPPRARRLLEIRQALSKSSIKKFRSMLDMVGDDNRIRGTLLYHGASTGRYTGRGIQPQNFAKPKIKDVDLAIEALEAGDYEWFRALFGDVFTGLSACLRGMLCAAPSNEFFDGDFSAIEARVVLWLAGDTEHLELYYQGRDAYREMAAKVFGLRLTEVKDFPHRDLGKRIILGAGFGMAAPKFKQTCFDQGGLVITEEFSKTCIAAYREEYALVKEFWYKLDDAARTAVKNPGKTVPLGHLLLRSNGEYLKIKLPSGRKLSYYKPRVRTVQKAWGLREELCFLAVDATTKQFRSESTYGGKLAENVTQAVARDLMTEAMTRLEARGYPVVMTVHDELISERLKGAGSIEEFLKIMEEAPTWGKGIPLKVGGWAGKCYKKA